MHVHRAILKCFEDTFGAKFLRLLKPSTQMEAWVGFDQGWSRTELSNTDLFEQLKSSIVAGATSVNQFVLGYFMQFKAVQEMRRLSRYAPSGFAAPYFRIELSLEVNPTTGLSQHETLIRLSQIAGTDALVDITGSAFLGYQ